jgi:hypothetical protein
MMQAYTEEQKVALIESIHYDPDSGIFTWLKNQKCGKCAGDIAGSINGDGYRLIQFNGKSYKAHRLAFLYVTGSMPNGCVDHINGVRDDNRFKNLRRASLSQNGQNMALLGRNKSGFKGVCWSKRKSLWQTQIKLNGKQYHLGYYEDIELAALVASEARFKFFGEYNRAAGYQVEE